MYTVEELLHEGGVRLAGGGPTLSLEQAKRYLRLSFAQTYASCQGTEFDWTLRLHDIESPRFTKRHLFVGLSRAKGAALVDLAA
jgi:hypothetical protein